MQLRSQRTLAEVCVLQKFSGENFSFDWEGDDVSLLVTVCLEPMVAKAGGEESLATVAEQLGACQYSY